MTQKKFDISISAEKLKLLPTEKEFLEKNGPAAIFENVLTQALAQRYPDGLSRVSQRIHARLLEKLDAVSSLALAELDLESAEWDMLRDVFLNDSMKFHPSQTRLVSQYLERLE